jgi:monoamine oxidase
MRGLGLMPEHELSAEPLNLERHSGNGTKVVVLGGGIAGLVAAYEMRKAGYDCTVLEARSRPGGRNWTVRSGTTVEFVDGTRQAPQWEAGNYLNAGPARLPAIHKTMLRYCQDLGVPLEVEVNTSRSALLVNPKAFDGNPIEQRQAINDTRGHVAELLAKSVRQGALDQDVTAEDRVRMLEFLRQYGDLKPDLAYKGSQRSGVARMPGAGDLIEELRSPLDMHQLLDAGFWRGMLFEEQLDMQATMFQPVGGMDRIPYAFAKTLGSIVQYRSVVKEIRKTSSGVRVAYNQGGSARSFEAHYCICALPLSILRSVPNDFSPAVSKAIADTVYADAYKIGWESKRFWETDYQIYGGISWIVGGPVELVWYPSAGLLSDKGVIVSGYAREGNSAFAKLPGIEAKIAASRAAVEQLHPGHGQSLTKPVYVNWGKIPFNEGSWISSGADPSTRRPDFYKDGPYAALVQPDDRIYFAGDHCSHVPAWQEGAALSALRTLRMIDERVRATRSISNLNLNPRIPNP